MSPTETKVVETIAEHPDITETQILNANEKLDRSYVHTLLERLEKKGEIIRRGFSYQVTRDAHDKAERPKINRRLAFVVLLGLILIATIVWRGLSSYN
jgi:DNA-binding MarR family transcriptional regulator